MRRNIPDWSDFKIQDATKYLGFYVGPGAGRLNWTEQIAKCKSRVQCIQSAKASIKLNVHSHNIRVVPVLGYVAQLLGAPDCLDQVERAMLHTILRLPQNALCHSDFFHLSKLGGPCPRSITAACASALFRTACKTVTNWPYWIQQLETAATECMALGPWVMETLSVEHWDSPPIACNLREASRGFPSSCKWSEGGARTILAIRNSKSKATQMQKVCCEHLLQASDTLRDTMLCIYVYIYIYIYI